MLKGLKESYRNDAVYQVLLQKEYEITSQLQHPMIVSVFSLEEVEGLGLCIVMEWIEGLTLKEWLAQGNHSRKQRRHVADMLLEALAYVQSRQTQHRDLKPSNIMLTHDGQHLKLI
jgi:serine/threonine protein kinase